MVQALKRFDFSTLALIAGVAVLHLWALSPMSWMHDEWAPEDEMEVVVEVAPNRPTASAGAPAQAAPPPKASVSPSPNASSSSVTRTLERADEVAAASSSTQAAPTAVSSAPSPSAPASNGADVPSTNVSYEVGSAKNPRPPYPPVAFMSRTEGRVLLKVHVLPDGKPAEIQLLQSSGSAQLDKSALDTLAKWELQPARKNGEPIDQWIEIPIHFRVLPK